MSMRNEGEIAEADPGHIRQKDRAARLTPGGRGEQAQDSSSIRSREISWQAMALCILFGLQSVLK